ncbi:uncharacterized protein LOC109860651 isoform X1 [Pseudomyrmex gracilis]|uniref:uncharacterized protein LOC109860651 isoform X1 n=1 Tax=Pseudomyrmex gracilis TaxID=219809 RepID=UPI000995A112|nr:uncharacterized protein LOC109860651 isoform X1 [Pseudomyrmex gracilis]
MYSVSGFKSTMSKNSHMQPTTDQPDAIKKGFTTITKTCVQCNNYLTYRCNFCNVTISIPQGVETSLLQQHLEARHANEASKFSNTSAASLSKATTLQSDTQATTNHKDKINYTFQDQIEKQPSTSQRTSASYQEQQIALPNSRNLGFLIFYIFDMNVHAI